MKDNIYLSIFLKDDILVDDIEYPLFVKRDESKKAYSLLFKMLDYLDLSVNISDICCSDNGKPYIKNSKIRFNYSHSKKYIAVAIGFVEVGVDIEDEFNISKDASSLYLPGIESDFRRVFVSKEAYCKLIGDFDDEFFKKLDINTITKNNYTISSDQYDLVLYYDGDIKKVNLVL